MTICVSKSLETQRATLIIILFVSRASEAFLCLHGFLPPAPPCLSCLSVGGLSLFLCLASLSLCLHSSLPASLSPTLPGRVGGG